MSWTPLPLEINNFKEMIEKGYYYVDKTKMHGELNIENSKNPIGGQFKHLN